METFEPNHKERHRLVPAPHFSYTKRTRLVYYSVSCCLHVTIFPEGDTGTRNSALLPLLAGWCSSVYTWHWVYAQPPLPLVDFQLFPIRCSLEPSLCEFPSAKSRHISARDRCLLFCQMLLNSLPQRLRQVPFLLAGSLSAGRPPR